jgi:hypothetical protein
MKKLKKPLRITLIVVSAIVFVFAALTAMVFFSFLNPYVNPALPIYQLTDEDGISVIIGGVRYKQLPALKWGIDLSIRGEAIGYASDRSTVIWLEETGGNFIYLKGQYADYYDVLYRADKFFPEPSPESVDKIEWEDYVYVYEKSEIENSYTNIVKDPETIQELFGLLDQGEKTDNFDGIQNETNSVLMLIKLYCTDLPGVYYELEIGLDKGRIICGRPLTGYVYMPEDLLEKIAGKKIDVDELLG